MKVKTAVAVRKVKREADAHRDDAAEVAAAAVVAEAEAVVAAAVVAAVVAVASAADAATDPRSASPSERMNQRPESENSPAVFYGAMLGAELSWSWIAPAVQRLIAGAIRRR